MLYVSDLGLSRAYQGVRGHVTHIPSKIQMQLPNILLLCIRNNTFMSNIKEQAALQARFRKMKGQRGRDGVGECVGCWQQ